MNLTAIAQALIDKHAARNSQLKGLIGATARDHYRRGVSDVLRALQEAAVAVELGQPSAPFAAQPSHSAVGGTE